MLLIVLVLQVLLLIVALVLLVRRPAVQPDPRMAQFLAADLPTKVERLDARLAALSEASERSAAALRTEVLGSIQTLGKTLSEGLDGFRTDNSRGAETLRTAVEAQLGGLMQRFVSFANEAARNHAESREALQRTLNELGANQGVQQEKLRQTMQDRLDRLNADNAMKLEEMRQTVDEKLQKTLNERLTASFGQVTTHLGEVQKGLGEMKELATGVGDLKKVLTNVKARGVVGEFQLGQQLEQMFSPEQYVKNARIKPDTQESVEYALKFPNGPNASVLLAIDSKFPREDWERLEAAYEHGDAEEIASAGKAFERAIRAEGKKICEKYIDPPVTLPHAVMFLPTEGLYAEVVRRPGLQSEIQQQCHVTIAGPSTFMAILTSFQMGFHTLAIEKKGNEVWRVLAAAKKEFDTFGDLMSSMEKQVGTVQNTIQKLGVRSRAIGRSLKDVASLDGEAAKVLPINGVLPMLAADEDA